MSIYYYPYSAISFGYDWSEVGQCFYLNVRIWSRAGRQHFEIETLGM